MKSFIVFSERCELKKIPANTQEYNILQRHQLLKALRKEIACRSNLFSQRDIQEINDRLKPLTNVSPEVKQNHIDSINKRIGK